MKTANSSIGIKRAFKMVCATFVIAFSTCISSNLYAQAVETGHETVRGELNFSAKAAYLLDHPEPLVINFKDTAKKPRIPVSSDYIDPSMMHSRPGSIGGTPAPMTPMSAMPVSTAADLTFQSTLDNGTTIPPDTHGAIDSTYCVTTVNSAVRIQTRAGGSVSSVSLNAFWSPVHATGGTFDPRVHYDPYINRWMIVAVCGAASAGSSILVAVSKTGNPTGDWWQYKIATGLTDYWLDFPNVGFNNKWITVSGVFFHNTTGSYGNSKTFVFNKANLAAGTSASFTAFSQTSSNLCPALTYDNTLGSMFLVERFNGSSSAMKMWKISGAVGSESMSTVGFVIGDAQWWYQPFPVSGTSFADFAPQTGISNKINNGDDRVTQLQYINGKLWFAHTIFLPYNASLNPTRSAIQWWQTDTLGNPIQFGRIDDASTGKFYAYPSIAVNVNNDALIGFSEFSAATHPSAAYALRLNTDPTDSFRTPYVFRSGQNTYFKTYSGTKNRWGDYSGAVVDPTNNIDFWTIQEASATTANLWDTWWARVTVASCSTPTITGTLSVCAGSTTTLTSTTSGGTWTSASTGIATVVSGTGVVSGVSAGTAVISYSVSGGCVGTAIVTVNALPNTITGTASVCVGATTALASTTGGGTWSSSNTSIATAAGTTGTITGVSAGTATISYTLSTGCRATRVVTVNALPASITGTASVCVGSTTSLSSSTGGGTWSSSNSSIATATGTTGTITGVSAGTATISYILSTGCRTTTVVTVNAAPGSITGTASVCVGLTTSLSSSTGGGTWSSSNSSIATATGTTGTITGVSAGTATISYTLATGCRTTTVLTVNAAPSSITGTAILCAGSTSSLTSTPSGGTWSSSNTGVATVGVTSGILSGVSSGTSTISYTVSGCRSTTIVTVNAATSAGTISGATTVGVGSSTTLSSTVSGGVWTSSNTSIATVGSSSGSVTGVSSGSVVITYTAAGTCPGIATFALTVGSAPAGALDFDGANDRVSLGVLNLVSAGSGQFTAEGWIYLNTYTSGDQWIFGDERNTNTGILTSISSTGFIQAYHPGAGFINTSANVPVNTWTHVAFVQNASHFKLYVNGAFIENIFSAPNLYVETGEVSYLGAFTADHSSYSRFLNGKMDEFRLWSRALCDSEIVNNMNCQLSLPQSGLRAYYRFNQGSVATNNSGITTLIDSSGNGLNGTLTNFATTGTTSNWVAGHVTGTCGTFSAVVSAGTISGASSVCSGSITSLSSSVSGGSWSSSNPSVASVSSTGLVTGASAGTATITYTVSTSCGSAYATRVITVNAVTGAGTISGATSICTSGTATLTATVSGGTWSSSNTAVATVSGAGIVTGVSEGSATITYFVVTSCDTAFTTHNITVGAAADAGSISGASSICAGTSTTLTATVGEGSWSSSNTSVATVNSSGEVSGISGGTAAITYSVGGGCGSGYAVHVISILSLPAPISGATSVCEGSTITLTCTPGGGTWSSSGTIATVDETSGVVTGMSFGFNTITYTAGTGCYVTLDVTVNSLPDAITGTTAVCIGSTTTLSSAPGGGVWTSSNTTRATVDGGTGVVSGISSGTVSISYTLSTGCRRKVTVSVIATPSSITGSLTVCAGSTTTLTSSTTGGSWSSSDAGVATVDASTGLVTGVGAGTTTIMYSIGSCSVSTVVTVAGSLTSSTGSSVVCVGGSVALSNATAGGTWSSSDAAIATVTSSTGIVTGVSTGVVMITYSSGAGCYTIFTMTVNAAVADITGTLSVCPGSETELHSETSDGTWSSSNTARATVVTGDVTENYGYVTGVSAGTVTILYSVSAGCSSSAVLTVLSAPTGISGTAVVCEGSTTTLTCTPGGGTWSSSGSEATVGSTGIVTGVSAGTVTINYTNSSGCSSSRIVTVNATPTSITGTLGICVGGTATLSSTPSGGTWVVANVTKATVGSSTGVITGVAVGSTAITYTAGGCRTISTVTVSTTPSAIGGTQTVCVGSTTTLTSATTGGTWTSGDGAIATVVAGTGVVTGVSAGTVVISYSNGTCERTAIVTVNAALGANTGSSTVCVGSSTTLSNATTGGTWSSSSTGVATVNTTTGVVVGVSAGTTNISYRLGAGCFSVTEVTVTPALSSITGTASVCPGATTTLSHASGGGAWSSGNLTRATVNAGTGVVTGVSAGTVFITYTLGGCTTSTTVTVNTPPAAITGTASVCVGATTNLASTTSGGTWTSSDGGVATVVSGTGVVTGVGAGTATISYQTGSGCVATREVTVTAAPGSISGTLSACIGTTTTLSNATSGGTWSSSNPAKATVVSGTGVVTGVSAGTSIITYATSSTCLVTAVVTISAAPSSIAGTLTVCDVCTTTLSTAVSGGVWSSSDGAVATVVAGTGVVSGVSIGTATISYVVSGCTVTAVVTVTPSTSPSTGTPVVCVGQTNSTLSNPVSGGTWSSSNISIATVHATTGILTGVSVGNANITYTTSPGIYTIIVATVSAATSTNAGTFSICPLTTTTLTNATGGGTWSSGNTLIATVVSGTGVVTGVASGTANISYIVNVGCYRVSTMNILVPPNITASSSINSVRIGQTKLLTVSPSGGVWTSNDGTIASVTTTAGTFSGRVLGVSVGATTVTYTMPSTGCFRTRAMTVTLTRPGAPVVSEAAQSGVLTVYPNPTSGVITVDAPDAGTFTVYTIDGREVAQYAVTASANVVTLPSNLAAGVYMCRFMGEDGTTAIVKLVFEQK